MIDLLNHGTRPGAQAKSATLGQGVSPFAGIAMPLAAEHQANQVIDERQDPRARLITARVGTFPVNRIVENQYNPWVHTSAPEPVRTTPGGYNHQVGRPNGGPEVHQMDAGSEEFVSFEGEQRQNQPSSSSRETPSPFRSVQPEHEETPSFKATRQPITRWTCYSCGADTALSLIHI